MSYGGFPDAQQVTGKGENGDIRREEVDKVTDSAV
jgi:hypothetical protein